MAVQATVLLSYVMPDNTAGSIWIDASVSEQHGAQAQVTEHQVESGENLADYIRPMPQKLSLQAHVTNTPITAKTPSLEWTGASPNIIGAVTGGSVATQTGQAPSTPSFGSGIPRQSMFKSLTFDNSVNRPQLVYEAFVSAVQAGAIWSIFTSLSTYTNMALTNVSAPRDAASGNAIQFQLDFQQIRVVDSQEVSALPKSIQKVHKGKQAAKEADDNTATKSRSALKAVVSLFGGK